MIPDRTNRPDAVALGLGALAATLGDARRAERLLAITGLDPDTLRARAGERPLLAAVLGFLADHEPDLIAVAADLGVRPAALIDARAELER